MNLDKFKQLINIKIADLITSRNNKKTTIDQIDFDGDDVDESQGALIASIESDTLNRVSSQVVLLVEALNKIKQNTYGICEECDEEISERRLTVCPEAKYCIKCAELLEKEQSKYNAGAGFSSSNQSHSLKKVKSLQNINSDD